MKPAFINMVLGKNLNTKTYHDNREAKTYIVFLQQNTELSIF